MPNLNDELEKLHYVFNQLELLDQLKDSSLSEFSKRSVLRFYFVAVDNVLKAIGWIKNQTRRNRKLSEVQLHQLERAIAVLRHTYDSAYDRIRDKLTAHQQNLELSEVVIWWNEIDRTTIEVLRSDLTAIRSALENAYPPLADRIAPLLLDTTDEDPQFQAGPVRMNATRLSIALPNSVSLVPEAGSQQKASMIVAGMRFIRADFYLTLKGQDWQTREQGLLFEIGWFLAILDFTSILDCLFDDSKEPSLVTLWTQMDMAGATTLTGFSRDQALERDLREVRNKLAAHIDSASALRVSHKLFEELDLNLVYNYCNAVIQTFLAACRRDIRTRLFLIDGMDIEGAISVVGDAAKPFDR